MGEGRYLHQQGGHNGPGIDQAWDAQVLDALVAEDGGSGLEPGHVVGAVQQLGHDHACQSTCPQD